MTIDFEQLTDHDRVGKGQEEASRLKDSQREQDERAMSPIGAVTHANRLSDYIIVPRNLRHRDGVSPPERPDLTLLPAYACIHRVHFTTPECGKRRVLL